MAIALFLAFLSAGPAEPPRAIYPDDPPWGVAAAPDYAALHGYLHRQAAAGRPRPALVAVGAAAAREAAALAVAADLAWTALPDGAARAAGFSAPGCHWLWWDGAVLRHSPPQPLESVVPELPFAAGTCPGGVCGPRR